MSDGKPRGSLRSNFRNPVSVIGLLIVVVSLVVGLPLMLVDLLAPTSNPYTGIFTYLIAPSLAAVGVVISFLGFWLTLSVRKRRPGWQAFSLPRIDLNNLRHRSILVGVFAGLMAVVALMTVTAYRSYQFSDSVQFCGQSCHSVMKPEYTAYQHSPHARVACVACHIGPGVGWFVKSKISGAYQLYSVTFKKYSRPIATPVRNLRPAQETCEQCHWPAKFFGAQQKTFNHYLMAEKNPAWQIEMLIKIGGGDPTMHGASGIHLHMNIKNKIDYIATDDQRETIPYVRSTDPQGRVTEYMSVENPLSAADLSKYTLRRMDCVDCHNRPSHIFNPPDRAVDVALYTGEMDASLPFVKHEAVRLLSTDYATQKEASDAIVRELPAFYGKTYPELSKSKSAAILRTTQALQALYSANMFPEMKTDWRAHTNHLSHLNSDGCFRCHDGLHKSADGKVVPHDCNTCHTILAQGSPEAVAKAPLHAQNFVHPVDVGIDVTTVKCSTCHSGTTGL